MESNHRPPPYQGGALPTELRERETCSCCLDLLQTLYGRSVERETGIEPALVAWKATVLPLNYSRTGKPFAAEVSASPPRCIEMVEGGGWLRPLRGLGPSGRAGWRAQASLREACRTRTLGGSNHLRTCSPCTLLCHSPSRCIEMVEGGGFEPPKA